MDFPKSIESRIQLIAKRQVDVALQCRTSILDSFNPNNDDFWFPVSIWLKNISKALSLRDRLIDIYSLELDVKVSYLDKYPHYTFAKDALGKFIFFSVTCDEDVIKRECRKLRFINDYDEDDFSKVYEFKQSYFSKRLEPKIEIFLGEVEKYCGRDWVYNVDYASGSNEVIDDVIETAFSEEVPFSNSFDQSDPYEFERFCAEILSAAGWSASVTTGGGDQGVDVIAKKENFRLAVQCKLYSSNVSNKAVQEVYAGKGYYECNAALLVSTAGFTKSAKRLAQSLGVYLASIEELSSLADAAYFEAN